MKDFLLYCAYAWRYMHTHVIMVVKAGMLITGQRRLYVSSLLIVGNICRVFSVIILM